ncbi:MAG: excinuclease ABC subunit UvrC [Patescibacteria group bacterium]
MDQILLNQLKHLPAKPGIYEFLDAKDNIFYIGKAKSLKSRVSSYFRKNSDLSPAKQEMIKQIHHLKTTVVDNEQEALLLESNLIKQHRPLYNIIFKDDKNWLYLTIDYNEPFPKVELSRRTKKKKIKYFGPYTSASSIRAGFRLLKKILALRTCKNASTKPCFDSTLGRCLGHQLESGSKKQYQDKLKQLEQFLKGNSKLLLTKLKEEMKQTAKDKQFEQAARLRDQLRLLQRILIKQKIISRQPESFDVIGLATQGNLTAVSKLPVRQGVLWAGDELLIEHDKNLPVTEILTDFLERYYPQVTEKPKNILLSYCLPKLQLKINIQIPQKGKKRELVKLADKNAQNFLRNSFASWQKQEARATAGLAQLKKILRLKNMPKRIEGYDISNIQGKHAVGALVVLTKGLLDKAQYRKFIIKKVTGPNDVAMLAEVLARRFGDKHTWAKPDLIMLDGGKPQLNTIIRAFKKKNIAIPLVALAKQEEKLFIPGHQTAIKLPSNSPGLLLLEQLRDEAHRFSIIFYRSRHRKNIIAGAQQL